MKDPYIDTKGILKNKLGITDEEELQKAEKDIAFAKLISIGELEKTECNGELFKKIHLYIFGDIYEWAGNIEQFPYISKKLLFQH